MNAFLSRPERTCAAISDEALGLTRIFEADIQLAQWRRAPDADIVHWLDTHAAHFGSGLRQLLPVGRPPELGQLPAGAGRDALAEDLMRLGAMLAELLDAPRIGLRLEVLQRAMCPRLHVDRVGIRMLCTYRGPGTEWVEAAHAEQRFPDAGAAGAAAPPAPAIQSIPPFTVALLKGSLWQGNGGRGLAHRSPQVPSPPRVLLALDACW